METTPQKETPMGTHHYRHAHKGLVVPLCWASDYGQPGDTLETDPGAVDCESCLEALEQDAEYAAASAVGRERARNGAPVGIGTEVLLDGEPGIIVNVGPARRLYGVELVAMGTTTTVDSDDPTLEILR